MVVTFIISNFWIPDLMAIPAEYILLVVLWYFVFALILDDVVKVSTLNTLKQNILIDRYL